MIVLQGLLSRALQMATPLLLGALGEIWAERAGVMNMAIEGIFIAGAWGGFVGAYLSGSAWVGLFTAVLCGIFVGSVYGFFAIKLKQHQIVTGVALNILFAGMVVYFYRVLFGVPLLPLMIAPLPALPIPFLADIPWAGAVLFRQNALTYFALLAVPWAWYRLYRTRKGLVVRSTGANPEAVDAAGLSVDGTRFGALMVSSALSGLAGAFYSVGYLGMFAGDIIGGRGWIAFALCFLGNWNPLGALAGALAFGIADAAAVTLQTSGFRWLPNEFLIALPYLMTIAATVVRRRFNVPATLGVPYRK
jgi:simple sugar transport system permease protein